MKKLLVLIPILSLLFASHSWAAIAFVSSVSAGAGVGGGTFTTGNFDSSGANLIVCGLSSAGGVSEPVVTDSNSNTPTLTITEHNNVSTHRSHLIYFVAPTVGAGHNFTVTGVSKLASIACLAFSGAHTSNPIDAQNGAVGGPVTSLATGSVTTTANSVTVTHLIRQTTGLATIDNSFIVQEEVQLVAAQHFSCHVAYKLNAGTVNPTWSFASSSGATSIASFLIQAATTSVQGTSGFLGAIIK